MRCKLAFWAALLLPLFIGCEGKPVAKNPGTGSKTAAGNTAANSVNESLTGAVKIEGSSTVGPISAKAREEFNVKYPKVNVSVGEQGTSNGFASFVRKEIDIADASRPIKPAELEKCVAGDIKFYELPVAYDGLTFVVNKENQFCKQLTLDQLKKIFRADMAVKTWNELDPSWPAEKIDIFAPGINSGTHEYCMEVLVGKEKITMRADEQITLSEDDKQLVAGVSGEKFGIGFFGYSYYESSKNKLRAVPIVNSKGEAIEPTITTVENGTYEPFSRPLFIYVNSNSQDRAEVAEFTTFYLKNATDIVKKAQYIPLPAELLEKAMQIVESGATGTRYINDDGTSAHGPLRDMLNRTPNNGKAK
ncbi:MAG: PstS family phosphate ABC transporter substrate-binding protein [Pirellulaceae bacterium]